MSFKEVNSLRKSGSLEEAFQMATADLQNEPNDIWSKRAMGWVYYEFVKKAVEINNITDFLVHVGEINALKLPEDETMLSDSLAWQIGKLLYANKLAEPDLNKLFELIKTLSFSYPANQYSYMMKAFSKHGLEWNGYLDFVEWWGLSNFQQDDFVEFITEKGNKIPSTVESVYIKISKKLLIQPYNLDTIRVFVPKIAKVAIEYKKMQYPPYYYAKLLIALGDKKNFMQAFLPFARKKQKLFWVWDLMSNVFETDSKEYFSCLCKALSCGAPDKFTINVREKFAKVLGIRNMLPQAKYEYIKILETRKNEGWVLNEKHFGWLKDIWWDKTEASDSNTSLYNNNIEEAMLLLNADTPEDIVCVEHVNNDKKIINFVVSKNKYGFASYSSFNIKPKTGDVFAVRFEEKIDNKSNFYKVITINNTKNQPSSEIHRNIEGNLEIMPGNSFGFVNNVYVPPQLIEKYKLVNSAFIKGIAINKYQNGHKDWKWSVIKIL
jgi:hypothetical protein